MNKRLILIIRYLVALLMLISICIYFKRHQEMLRYLYNVNVKYCILLFPMIFLSYIIGSANLFILLKAKNKNIFWLKWFRFHFTKRFMNMHLPQSGNVYEAIKMKEKFGIDIFSYTKSFGAVNWFNACFNCAVSLIVLVAWTGLSGEMNFNIIVGILIILILLIIVPPLIDYCCLYARDIASPGAVNTLANKAHELVLSMRRDILKTHIFIKLLFWNSLFFCMSVGIIFIGFRTLDINIALKSLIPFVVLNTMVGLISILPGNIGIVEYAYGFIGSAINLSMSIGILLSLIFRLITYIVFLTTFLIFVIDSLLRKTRDSI